MEIVDWIGILPMIGLIIFAIIRLSIAGIISAAIMFVPSIFMENSNAAHEIISGLQSCVVDGKCPVNDSRVHIMVEQVQWTIIKIFNQNEGVTILTEWVIITLGLFFTRWRNDRPPLSI